MIPKTLLLVLITGTAIAAPSVPVNAFYCPIGPVGICCQRFDPYSFEGKSCNSPQLNFLCFSLSSSSPLLLLHLSLTSPSKRNKRDPANKKGIPALQLHSFETPTTTQWVCLSEDVNQVFMELCCDDVSKTGFKI
jgi:hypothetical protein